MATGYIHFAINAKKKLIGDNFMDKTKISTLIQSIIDSDKDQYDFTDIVDLDNALTRRLHLGAIDSDFADAVDNYIRFFNRLDDEEQVPIGKREPI